MQSWDRNKTVNFWPTCQLPPTPPRCMRRLTSSSPPVDHKGIVIQFELHHNWIIPPRLLLDDNLLDRIWQVHVKVYSSNVAFHKNMQCVFWFGTSISSSANSLFCIVSKNVILMCECDRFVAFSSQKQQLSKISHGGLWFLNPDCSVVSFGGGVGERDWLPKSVAAQTGLSQNRFVPG